MSVARNTVRNARTRIVILGAAGRDFHNFNVAYRGRADCEVVAFTGTQIPGIAGRRYPAELAGPLYPKGIAIVEESGLEALLRDTRADQAVFAYSDVPHTEVMHIASRVLASGADFILLGAQSTMLKSARPVIAVSAVRTGCGKSQVARWIVRRASARGLRVAAIRHPMPYGDLARQAMQRFATRADLDAADCTIEEREEYEPHIEAGGVVFAGVDYAGILAAAEAETDLIVWDGGNNDFPFLHSDLHIVLADALRPGHESTHHPGEAVLHMADVMLIAKSDSSTPERVSQLAAALRALNPNAAILRGGSPITLDDEAGLRGMPVAVVEDGPTTTHGSMASGAGLAVALRAGAKVIDPRPYAAAEIRKVYDHYPHLGPVLPATGYSAAQVDALTETLDNMPIEAVISGTPIDLGALLHPKAPVLRARYEFEDMDSPGLGARIDALLDTLKRDEL